MISSGLRSIARNTGQMTGARLVGPVVQAGYVVLLAAYLGPELFGLLSYSRAWYLALLPIAVLGLGPVLSREIGADRTQAPEVVARALTLRVGTTLLAALTCAAIGYGFEADPTVRALIGIFSLALAARAIGIFAEQVFVAFESSSYMLRQEALFRPLEAGVGSVVVVVGGGVLEVALVHTVIWGLQACRGLYLVRSRLVPLGFDLSWSPLVAMLRQGILIGVAGFCTVWLLHGQLILYRHAGASESALGQFGLAIQLLGLIAALPISMGAAAMPVLSRAVTRGDRKEMLFVDGMCRLVLMLGTVAAIGAMAGGPWVAEAVFGAGFAPAGRLFGPVLWLLIPFTIGHTAQTVLFAKARLRDAALCAGSGALVLTVSLLPLAATFDALGVVLAAAIGMGTWAVASLVAVARSEGLILSRVLLRPAAAIACAIIVYWALNPLGSWPASLGSVVTVLVAGLVFGVVSPEERSAVLGVLRRREKGATCRSPDLPPTGTDP